MEFKNYVNETNLKVSLLILFHAFGVLAASVNVFQPLFKIGTPYHLIAINGILFWQSPSTLPDFLKFAFIAASIGFVAELVGVNFQLLFGNYHYTEALGLKIWNVPLLIGLTWAGTAYACNTLIHRLNMSLVSLSILGASLMVGFDFVLEHFAMAVPLWTWENNQVPLYNYFCWFLIGVPVSYLVHYFRVYASKPVAIVFLLSQILFFMIYLCLSR